MQKSDLNKENFLEQQNYYLNLIAELMSVRKRGETPLAFIHTYGCQQNVADSEKIKGMLSVAGFEFADKPEDVSEGDYLVGSIREGIEMYILEQGDQSAVGKKAVEKADKLHKAICELEEELEHKVTKEEVSAFLNIPVEEIDEVIRLSGKDLGL